MCYNLGVQETVFGDGSLRGDQEGSNSSSTLIY